MPLRTSGQSVWTCVCVFTYECYRCVYVWMCVFVWVWGSECVRCLRTGKGRMGRKPENTSDSKQGFIFTLLITDGSQVGWERRQWGAEQEKAIPVRMKENVRDGSWTVGSIPEDKWIREIKFTWIRGYGLTANIVT